MLRSSHPGVRADEFVAGFCALLSVLLLLLPDGAQVQVAHALSVVLVNPWLEVRNFGEDVLRLRAENARLSAQVKTLELRLEAGKRAVADLERGAGPALPPGCDEPLAPCQVIARKRSRLATMIQIRSLEPLVWHPDLAVVTPLGFLGRLHTVIDDHGAWVELLSAPDMALGVEFERTGLAGVLRPRAGRFVVELVGRDEDVMPGDVIITSGIAEIRDAPGGAVTDPVPRGLQVAVVSQVSAPSDRIFKEIAVEPLADFQRNETVYVVGARPRAPRAAEAGR
ncbi:MAG TPA: rod shape-determining protein MreC [Candidatus Krumholzibacteria bacterium]|nr:rod shape-determining protein MreC [Candidatus Krumholzibacteria bacterium]HPD71358.1 rod shape-determining protein MreC [Candidatus Krumholzibacteria bacterium]HRY38942.1 rod shape-determining protein MreC [Candidatus Krumholzibacteria bacterium]